MHKRSYYIINAITFYRLLAAPILIFMIFNGNFNLFKWMLAVSFFTDLIDGFLARKFGTESVFGARLDSLGDDLTVIAAIIGIFVFKMQFVKDNLVIASIVFGLLIIQNIFALVRYHKISSFHTYSAKAAAILQGAFLILIFFLPHPNYFLFYAASVVTALDLAEEIILVLILPKWEANVKGIYWVLKRKSKNEEPTKGRDYQFQ